MHLILPLSILAIVAIGLFISLPGPIDAARYDPPQAPELHQASAVNERLQQAELLALGQVYGPEDIAVDIQGRIYGGTQDGKVVRLLPNGELEIFAITGGRPLGLHFDLNQQLIVCDAWKGLLSISPNGEIHVLASQYKGQPFQFTNDLDIARNGDIYFTDSSRFNQPDYMLDAFESRPHGRLFRYSPATKELKLLAEGLYFANGVALSKHEDFVIINETFRYQISRYWISGEKQGQLDLFATNLPGFPDGASANRQGTFWIALPTLRNPILDAYHPLPWVKNLIAKLPRSLAPKPQQYGLIISLNEAGEITNSFHDPSGQHLKEITAVEQVGQDLYMGSLHNDRIGRLSLPKQP